MTRYGPLASRFAAIVLALLASSCLFGPSIECDPSADLTEAECNLAADAALAKVSGDGAARGVVVRVHAPGIGPALRR